MPERPLPFRDADRQSAVAAGAGSCEGLLEELLAVLGRLEAEFTARWDAALTVVSA